MKQNPKNLKLDRNSNKVPKVWEIWEWKTYHWEISLTEGFSNAYKYYIFSCLGPNVGSWRSNVTESSNC